MWSGRIVPLFRRRHEVSQVNKPFEADRNTESRTYDPSNSHFPHEPEEMLMPLPEDICFGTGIRDGSIVHVAYQWNPPIACNKKGEPLARQWPSLIACNKNGEPCDRNRDLEDLREKTNLWLTHFGDDVAAWIVVSPFPIELLADRIMQVIVHLENGPEAFLNAVARPATKCSAAMLQAEGLSTGDEGSLLLFPPYMKESGTSSKDQKREQVLERMKEFIKTMSEVKPAYLKDFSVRVPSSMLQDIENYKDTLPNKDKIRAIQDIGWLEELVRPGSFYKDHFNDTNCQTLWTMKSKKITIRDRMITIPWGEVTRRYRDARWWIREEKLKAPENESKAGETDNQRRLEDSYDVLQPLPKYALLVRDPDLPVVIGVIPQRMLFQVIMRLRSSGVLTRYDNNNVGVGSVERVCDVLGKSRSNIWHIEQLPSQITFTERESEEPSSPSVLECSFIESDLRIVAACPQEWRYADEGGMQEYFKRLRHNLAQLRIPKLRIGEPINLTFPKDNSIKGGLQKVLRMLNARILLKLNQLDVRDQIIIAFDNKPSSNNLNDMDYLKALAEEVGIDNNTVAASQSKFLFWKDDDTIPINRLLTAWPDINEVLYILAKESDKNVEKCEAWLRHTLNEFGEPIVESKEDIEIHAPPLLRIFFSHSAHPDSTEKDLIDQIKEVLANYSESIVEGQFSAGLSTEQLSRGRIRLCSVIVSFFWPREEYTNKSGEHVPPEWVAHEESFAMGLGLRVIRIRERSVRNPRYEQDRPTIEFDRNDSHSWDRAKKKLAKELCEFVLKEAQKFLHR